MVDFLRPMGGLVRGLSPVGPGRSFGLPVVPKLPDFDLVLDSLMGMLQNLSQIPSEVMGQVSGNADAKSSGPDPSRNTPKDQARPDSDASSKKPLSDDEREDLRDEIQRRIQQLPYLPQEVQVQEIRQILGAMDRLRADGATTGTFSAGDEGLRQVTAPLAPYLKGGNASDGDAGADPQKMLLSDAMFSKGGGESMASLLAQRLAKMGAIQPQHAPAAQPAPKPETVATAPVAPPPTPDSLGLAARLAQGIQPKAEAPDPNRPVLGIAPVPDAGASGNDADANRTARDPGVPPALSAASSSFLRATMTQMRATVDAVETGGMAARSEPSMARGAAVDADRPALPRAPANRFATTPGAEQEERIDLIERMVRAAKMTQLRGQTRLKITLNPPELGSVKVDLAVKNRVLQGTLQADSLAAREILASNLPSLREALAERGIQVGELSVAAGAGHDPGQRPETAPDRRSSLRRGLNPRADGSLAPALAGVGSSSAPGLSPRSLRHQRIDVMV